MALWQRSILICALFVAVTLSPRLAADDVDLTNSGGTSAVWLGAAAGSGAGFRLFRGTVGNTDTRQDLVIAAPGTGADPGHAYVMFGRPRTGTTSLSAADIVYTGESGDRFGTSSANGNILRTSGTRDLLIGAPAAQGNRGVVYLFAGPPSKTAMTVADATFRIIGAAGDQLGTSLAAGDLNGDGFRDIIMGAAGTGRVYIVYGGSSLSGTLDLSVQPAAAVLVGPFIGAEIQSADLNADGLWDIAIGTVHAASTAGRVYVLRGRTLSGTINLDTAAETIIQGDEIGDYLGAAIRLADVNGGGFQDLVIGAPGADGPSNTRDFGGEAYVLFGGPSFPTGTRAVSSVAGVVFYGAAGDYLGFNIDAGDINRDSPDDLIFVSRLANGGNGDIKVFYGRQRSEFGTVVDLQTAYNRRLWASAADGPISAATALEISGEGANDVIVGLGSATVGDNAGAGKVLVALSPKMSPSPSRLMLGTQSASVKSVQVNNRGTGVLVWSASTTTPWLSLSGRTGTSTSTSPGAFTATALTAGLAPGTYTGGVTVRSESIDLVFFTTVTVTLSVKTSLGDMDGDGRADLTVFRPSSGTWFVQSSTGTTYGVQWGNASDLPVPGDYDGDGRIDIAVFRPSNGVWYLIYSSSGAAAGFQWGNGSDVPLPGDYDGDGKTDIAVFRPSNGTWYVRYSASGATAGFQWGNSADVPVPGDYDADGRTDLAVFRPSTGTWFVVTSSTGQASGIQWGNNSDVPVPGDYDGDGRTDLAVFRPSSGTWFVVNSSTGAPFGFQWGNSLDVPVPGDFDGDGRTDIAVFRKSSGTWYVRYSSTGATAGFQWGNASDIPILRR